MRCAPSPVGQSARYGSIKYNIPNTKRMVIVMLTGVGGLYFPPPVSEDGHLFPFCP